VATEGPAAAALLDLEPVASKSVASVAFAADEPPITDRLVVLDGTGAGPVLNVAVMSNVSPTYAPSGRHQVVAAMPGVEPTTSEGEVERLARTQLRGWWGAQVDRWETIATHRIAHGQPAQATPFSPKQTIVVDDGRYVCGDHRDTASIQGAMYSGRRTAVAIAHSFT
ncbi:MAG: FAD-dependent oxidoreductase, partial [Actinomycetota bacterium]